MSFIAYSIGVAATGAIIGYAIAMIEIQTRKQWLEVTIKPFGLTLQKERTLTVTLGDKSIVFGCSPSADVQVAEVSSGGHEFAKIFLDGNRTMAKNLLTQNTSEVKLGVVYSISNAHVVMRST